MCIRDSLSEEAIVEVNIPTGIPLVYEFDEAFQVQAKYYLGDAAAVEAKMKQVASQGKVK